MPASVSVAAVASKADQKAFIGFAWNHYRGDPYWVPPIRSEIKGLLNYRPHAFYQKSEIQTFLAYRDRKVVGRIAAIVDGFHNQHHKEQRGMFGFFESIDDEAVAKALFDTVKEWFAQKGITQLRGPANPSQNYEWGMLVDGFEEMPTFMMTYNKPFYGRLVEQNGFVKSQDMFAYVGRMEQLDSLDPKMLRIVNDATKRFNIKVRPVNKKSFAEDIESFLYIYNRAVQGQWGFTPLSPGELQETAGGLKHLIVPEMTTMAEVDGKVVGAVFGLLDYNPLIKKIDGKLFPFGIFRLLWNRRKLKRVRLLSTNVLPEYQRWGLGVVLMARLVPECKAWGIETGEFSWVLESNKLSRGTLERGGAEKSKTYRIYDYDGAADSV